MSITAHRATMLAAAAAAVILSATPAAAQMDQSTALNILVECAKIDDPTARLACYDNNIRGARTAIPGRMPVPQGGGAPMGATTGPRGFGFEDVRTPQRFEPRPGELDEINPRITAVRPREPGIYLVTVEDGAQWVFTEGVSFGFRPPRPGQTVTIDRGALGGFLMRIDGQEPVPVRRLR